jgi:DNA-binding CsgD family transcriptional regulator
MLGRPYSARGSIYRKLDISSRSQLAGALAEPAPA